MSSVKRLNKPFPFTQGGSDRLCPDLAVLPRPGLPPTKGRSTLSLEGTQWLSEAGLGVITLIPGCACPGSALLPEIMGSFPLASAGSVEEAWRITLPAPLPGATP